MGLLSGVGRFLGRAAKTVLPFLLPGGSVTSKLVGSIVGASSKAKQVGTTWKKLTGGDQPQEWENTTTKATRIGGTPDVLQGWQPVFRDEAGNKLDPKTGKITSPVNTANTTVTPPSATSTPTAAKPKYAGKSKRYKERKAQG